MESNNQIIEKVQEGFWTKKSVDLRHELITLFLMENSYEYEKVSTQFEKRVTSLGGHSVDDLLIASDFGLARVYVNGNNFKTEMRISNEKI